MRENYSSYRTAYDIAKHYRHEIVPLRKRIAEETLLRYNGMLIGVFELLADALIDGYAIEGHVPVREIERLLKERPAAIGLTVPGMVVGSPEMEQGGKVEPYTVLLLHRDGGSSAYAKYR